MNPVEHYLLEPLICRWGWTTVHLVSQGIAAAVVSVAVLALFDVVLANARYLIAYVAVLTILVVATAGFTVKSDSIFAAHQSARTLHRIYANAENEEMVDDMFGEVVTKNSPASSLSISTQGSASDCDQLKQDKVLIGGYHGPLQAKLEHKLTEKALAGKLIVALEGVDFDNPAILIAYYGSNKNIYGLESSDISILTSGLLLYHMQATLIRAPTVSRLQMSNKFKQQAITTLVTCSPLRKDFKASGARFSWIDTIIKRHKFVEMTEDNPHEFDGPKGVSFLQDINSTLDPREVNLAIEREWLELGRHWIQLGRQRVATSTVKEVADLMNRFEDRIEAFLLEPLTQESIRTADMVLVELRDIVMSSNLEQVCRDSIAKNLPIFVIVGAGHVEGLKKRNNFTRIYNDLSAKDFDEYSTEVQKELVAKAEREMMSVLEYLEIQFK